MFIVVVPYRDFPGGVVVRNLPPSTGDARHPGSVPGSGRSPGVGNGNPLQYSCLENYMDRGAWWAAVHGIAEWDTTERTHTQYLTIIFYFCDVSSLID